jgi:hypothetical protein
MRSIAISQMDTAFAGGSYPIKFLFYYNYTIPKKAVENILAAISDAFWPVFGQYADGMISEKPFRATNHVYASDLGFDFDAGEGIDAIIQSYRERLPLHLSNLFEVHIFHHSNGTVLIPRLNHLAGDGFSYFYILSVMALVGDTHHSAGNLIEAIANFIPIHNRTIFKPYRLSQQKIPTFAAREVAAIHLKYVPKKQVKEQLRTARKEHGIKLSNNDILTAISLKEIEKNNNGNFMDPVKLSMPVDVRGIVNVYGKLFFGNPLQFHRFAIQRAALVEKSVIEVASLIRQSIPEITPDSYFRYLDTIEQAIEKGDFARVNPFDTENECLVTNLSLLPAPKLNFGQGNPDFIVPLNIEKNSSAILADSENYILRLGI